MATANVQTIVDAVEKLSRLRLRACKGFEEKFGVSAAAPMMMGNARRSSICPAEEKPSLRSC